MPGVRNETYALKHRRSGAWICISATCNDKSGKLSYRRFNALVARLLHLLRK